MVKVRAAVVCLVPGVWAACPTGYEGPDGGGCFMMSERTGTFLECEAECESKGGTLASIRSASEDDFARSLAGQRAVYLGLFEAGEDESGDWQWVDGFDGSYRAWNPGDPNEWCTDEDCAVFAPSKFADWVDASCTVRGWARRGAGNGTGALMCRTPSRASERWQRVTRPTYGRELSRRDDG